MLHFLAPPHSVYLDYNATTPLEPEVLDAIHQALKSSWGNPSSSHIQGTQNNSKSFPNILILDFLKKVALGLL